MPAEGCRRRKAGLGFRSERCPIEFGGIFKNVIWLEANGVNPEF